MMAVAIDMQIAWCEARLQYGDAQNYFDSVKGRSHI